jgi:putative tryptophan/tyrosine transport system substrate-binding protein
MQARAATFRAPQDISHAEVDGNDRMRRREFVAVLGGAVALWSNIARAQQPAKVWHIGWVWSGPSSGNPQEIAGFRRGLEEFGYVEGQNVRVNYRFAEGQSDRIPGLVSELVQLRPDVAVAVGTLATIALKEATTVIPIVSLSGDPVGAGLVVSLARPGGNITGVTMMQGAEGLTGKRVQLLKDALPAATRIAMVFNPDFAVGAAGLAQAKRVASQLGLVLRPYPVRRSDEIEATITALAREGVDAVDIEPVFPLLDNQSEIATLLLKYRIPAVSELRLLVEAGGLLSYGPNVFDATRRQVYFVDRILKGAKPADLPVEQASKLELVVNLKTAKLLGLDMPLALLARADELVE